MPDAYWEQVGRDAERARYDRRMGTYMKGMNEMTRSRRQEAKKKRRKVNVKQRAL